jgi:cytochrome c553
MNIKVVVPIIGLCFLFFLETALSNNIENLETRELKSTDCGECHGENGNSKHPLSPSLAGQHTAYLIAQLNAFNNGTRQHPLMKTIAGQISRANIEALATYYSGLKPGNTDYGNSHKRAMFASTLATTGAVSTQEVNAQLIKQGEAIYTACSGCHGLDGEGIAPYPRLVGQHPDYLKQQLTNFKTGTRDGRIMKMMSVNLSDSDINALALYLATLNETNPDGIDLSEWKQ